MYLVAKINFNMQFETDRLLLREFSVDDAAHMYALNLDPEVIRYTGDGPFDSVESAKNFLENYDHYKQYGFGRWAVIRKSDSEWLGWCGLKYTESRDEHDIGFRFFKKYWGMGYATEAARKCLEVGFHEFDMPFIVGRAMKANLGSVRVLEKIGMAWWRDFDFEGEEGVIYRSDQH